MATMALYEYEQIEQAGGRDGKSAGGGVIEAPDRASAVRLLRERGITPRKLTDVEERRRGFRAGRTGDEEKKAGSVARGAGESARAGAGGGRVTRGELTFLIRDMSVALGAGLTLVQAMRVVQRQASKGRRGKAIGAMLEFLIGRIEQGKSLGDAASEWGKPFNELLVGLMRAGEQSGKLNEVLEQAATLLERDQKLRRSLYMGMAYPGVLAVLISGAVVVVVTVVVPRLLAPLAGKMSAEQLPWPTRVVMGVTEFVGSNWVWLGVGVCGVGVIGRQVLRDSGMRAMVDGGILRLPAVGRLARDVAVARFSRTMGTLVGAGLPVIAALKGAKATVGNKAMEASLEGVIEAVLAGKTIAEPMEKAGAEMFPPMLTQIVGVGEKSGRLGEMLERAARVFEDRSETSLAVVTLAAPIVLVLMAAATIGFVVFAVFMALLEVQEMIG